MKATNPAGDLLPIPNCNIVIPGIVGSAGCTGITPDPNSFQICLRVLPDITDAKSAAYQDEAVIGRSFPIKAWMHSENRTITMKVTFVILKDTDAGDNLAALRALQSAVYPQENAVNPFLPPPICKIQCGRLLSAGSLCVVLKQYSTHFPIDVVWYENINPPIYYLPTKLEVDLSWEVVYPNTALPGQTMIFGDR